jgi:hypothetical protein
VSLIYIVMTTENDFTTEDQPDSSSPEPLLPLSTIRSEGKKKKTSLIWKYFAAFHHSSPDYGKNKVVCLLCRDLGKNYILQLSCSKPSPTPLHNHVQTKHFDTFENYKVAEVQQKKGSQKYN